MWLIPAALFLAYSVAAMPPLNFTRSWKGDPSLLGFEYVQDFHETNPAETRYGELIEGDVLVDPEQDRKGVSSPYIWKNRKYNYRISDESLRVAAEEGINFWRDNTCITFTEVPSHTSVHHVEFVRQDGCWSYVGATSSAASQPLSLGHGCHRLGTVTHEIAHSLGFYHEQSRSDRDQHVTILLDNVLTESRHNFVKNEKTENFGVPYDFGSVMHYGARFFTKNGDMTIRTNDPTKQLLIGQRVGPSFRDIAQMNRMYKCEQLCASPPTCQNGGYVSADCTCHCPPNTSGAGCEAVTGPYYPEPACGGRITSPGAISSPNWPQVYPPGSQCIWWITPPAGRKARVTFREFEILRRYADPCDFEFLELSETGILGEGRQFCGSELAGVASTSTVSDGTIVMHFKAYSSYFGGKGFTATVDFV